MSTPIDREFDSLSSYVGIVAGGRPILMHFLFFAREVRDCAVSPQVTTITKNRKSQEMHLQTN